jgi:carboxypeptidase family protein
MMDALLVLLSLLSAVFQTPAANPAQAGTARIGGVVLDANGQPVPRAIVRLSSAELRVPRAAVTDSVGAFAFDELPAGRVSLTASKVAYLTAAYGAVRPGGSGTPVALAEGQKLEGVKMTMPRGGAIAGVIRDHAGAPIRGMSVYAQRVGTEAPALRNDGSLTDDRGAYRVFGLAPGEYYVYVLSGYGAGVGAVGLMSSAEVDTALARLQARNSATPAPSQERSPSSIVRPLRSFIPSPVFYPGVTTMAQTVPVTLGLGEVRQGVDVVYQWAPAASVTGTVTGAGAQNVSLTLISEDGRPQSPPLGFNGPTLQRRAAGDGVFEFTSVTPGKYTVMARVIPRSQAGVPPASEQQLFATTSVDVTGTDIAGLALVLRPALRVRGRLAFEGAAPPAAQTLSTFQLRLMPAGLTSASNAQANTVPGVTAGITGTAAPDGTFLIDGVIPGSYRLAFRDLLGWRVSSAKLGDLDVVDTPFDVSADVVGIDVTLTNRHSRLSGRLAHEDGSSAPRYFVVAFSADPSFWFSQSRRVRSVRPGTDGEFRFDDLPAGEYYLAALTDADSDDWQTEAFMTQVIPSAVRLKLADGEQKVQNLRIGR